MLEPRCPRSARPRSRCAAEAPESLRVRPGERVVPLRLRDAEADAETRGDLVEQGLVVGGHAHREALVRCGEEDRGAVLGALPLPPVGDGIRRSVGIGDGDDHGGRRQAAEHTPGERRIVGEQRREQLCAQAPRLRSSCCLLQASPAIAITAVTTAATSWSSDAAAIAITPRRCPPRPTLNSVNVRADAQRLAGSRPRRMSITVAQSSRTPASTASEGAELRAPAASNIPTQASSLPRELGEGGAEPVGAQRRQRDRALRGEGPAAARIGLRGDRLGVGAGHGDERRAVRHLEQRHAARRGRPSASSGGMPSRTTSVPKPRPDDAARRRVGATYARRCRAVAVELRARGEQRESLGEEGRRVGEVGAVHPAHGRSSAASGIGASREIEAQAQVRRAQQRAQRRGVGHGGHRRPPVGVPSTGRTAGSKNVQRGGCTRRRRRHTLANMSTTRHRATAPPLGGPDLPQERRLVTPHPRPALAGAPRPQGGRRRGRRRAHRPDRTRSPPAAASSSMPTATRSSTSGPASP